MTSSSTTVVPSKAWSEGFPPAANWFQSQMLAASSTLNHDDRKGDEPVTPSSRVIYGARNLIVLMDVPANVQEPPSFRTLRAFADRVKVLSVDLEPLGEVIVAGSEDGEVKAFTLKDEKALSFTVATHEDHKSFHRDRHRVQAISIHPETFAIASADETGNVVVWNAPVNARKKLYFGKNAYFAVKWDKCRRNILALGGRQGQLLIVDTSDKGGKILQKIRASDADIHAVSWAPAPTSVFARKSHKKFVDTPDNSEDEEEAVEVADHAIAVASKDKILTLWSTQTAAKIATIALEADKTGGFKSKPGHQTHATTCLWAEEGVIVASTPFGELVKVDLGEMRGMPNGTFNASSGDLKHLHSEHYRPIYSLGLADGKIFTCGHDRTVTAYDLASSSVAFSLPTNPGWVHCIEASPIEPSLLAYGGGEGLIRVWKTGSKTKRGLYDVSTFVLKASNSVKVTALAWHPDRENLLAVGTSEGRIGMLDVSKARNSPMLFSKHRDQVYTLKWGPAIAQTGAPAKDEAKPGAEVENEDNASEENPESVASGPKWMLYSCGDGKVLAHNSRELNRSPVNVDALVNQGSETKVMPKRSEMAFNSALPQSTLLAIGSDDGTVDIYSLPDLKPVYKVKTSLKLIQNLKFHPLYCTESEEVSTCANWLAVASNEHDIHLFKKFAEVIPSSAEVVTVTEPCMVLRGHHSRAIELGWSPHKEGQLVSVSYDRSAQVWDCSGAEVKPLANFQGHEARAVTCLWHPSDPDLVLTGGEDSFLFCWSVKGQKLVLPEKEHSNSNKKPFVKYDPPSEVASESGDTRGSTSNLNKKAIRKPKQFPLPLTYSKEKQSVAQTAEETLGLFRGKIGPEDEAKVTSDNLHLAVFRGEEATEDLLDLEAEGHMKDANFDLYSKVMQYSAKGGDAVREVAKQGKLTPYQVTLAFSTSMKLGQEMCRSYALQLESEEEYFEAASYHLMTNRVEDAVKALASGHHYREAIHLAKIRLDEDDPKVKELMLQWAKQCVQDGNFEMAARAFMAAGEPVSAANLLGKRPKVEFLKAAAIILKTAGDVDKAEMMARQCLAKCRVENNGKVASEVMEEFPKLKAENTESLEKDMAAMKIELGEENENVNNNVIS